MKQEFAAKFNGEEYKFQANPMHIRQVAMIVMTENKAGMIEVWQNDELLFICRYAPNAEKEAEAKKNGWGWNAFMFMFPEPQQIKPKPSIIILVGDGADDMVYGEEFSELHRLIDEDEIRVVERKFGNEDELQAFCDGIEALSGYDERAPQPYVTITQDEYDKILCAEYEDD